MIPTTLRKRMNGMSANALAQALGVPANRIAQILAGKRAMTADTALRLAKYFNTTPEFWLEQQAAHELAVARTPELLAALKTIVPRGK